MEFASLILSAIGVIISLISLFKISNVENNISNLKAGRDINIKGKYDE